MPELFKQVQKMTHNLRQDMLEPVRIGFLGEGEVIVQTLDGHRPTICTFNIVKAVVIGGVEYPFAYRCTDKISNYGGFKRPIYGALPYDLRSFELIQVGQNGMRLDFGHVVLELCSSKEKQFFPPHSSLDMLNLAPKPDAKEYSPVIGFSPKELWVAPDYTNNMNSKRGHSLVFFGHMHGFTLVASVLDIVVETMLVKANRPHNGPLAEQTSCPQFPLYLPKVG